jgi:hypothetical protein
MTLRPPQAGGILAVIASLTLRSLIARLSGFTAWHSLLRLLLLAVFGRRDSGNPRIESRSRDNLRPNWRHSDADRFCLQWRSPTVILMIQRVLVFLLTIPTIAFSPMDGLVCSPPIFLTEVKVRTPRESECGATELYHYSGRMSQRYSLLSQINSGNVQDLELKWSFPSQRGPNEATPLVVNGVMYSVHGPTMSSH